MKFYLQQANQAIEIADVPASPVTLADDSLDYIALRRPDGQFVKGHNRKVYPTGCNNVNELAQEIKATHDRLKESGLLLR